MKKDAIYSITAIAVLLVAVISIIFVRATIMADVPQSSGQVKGAQSSRENIIPLKAGWNYFVFSDFAIDRKSEIIEVNGEGFSVDDALAFGIIDKIVLDGTDQSLVKDIKQIPAGSAFQVYVSNIDNNPAVISK